MKRFFISLLVFAIIVGGTAIAFFFGIGYYLSPQSPLAKADAIVAISGGDTEARTDEAVRLYKDKWAPEVVFSGAAADTSGPSNAQAMATAAEIQGIPASAIHLDETSTNTRENAANVAKIASARNYHSIILVTSPYHQRRAEIIFHRALGSSFNIINHSSYDQQWRRSHWWATQYSRDITLAELQKVVYELVAGDASTSTQ